MPAITTWLLCQMVNKSNCEPLATQLTQDWSDRVVTNSGNPAMRPSANTWNAVHTFLCTLIQHNLHTRMMTMSVLPPDNIWSCITPVLNYGAGFDPWIIHTCTDGNVDDPATMGVDLTFGGLRSFDNAPLVLDTIYFDTGYVVDGARVDHGLTGIVTEIDAGGVHFGNIWIGGSRPNVLKGLELSVIESVPPDYTNYTSFDASNVLPGNLGRISITPPPGTADGRGFFSMSRRSNTDFEGYFAQPGSGFPFVSTGAKNSISGTPPNISMWFFSANFVEICADSRYSFVAAHLGYTTAETQILFNAVQQLRHDLGGGWV